MTGPTNDIKGLLGYLSICADRYSCHTLPSDVAGNYHAALTALVAERDGLRDELAAAIKQRDGLLRALEEIANQDYRGNGSNESLIAQRALAAMRKGGGA